MKTERKRLISLKFHLSSTVGIVAATLLFGALASSAQTGDYVYSGVEQTIALNSGTYDITAYGAQGGSFDGTGIGGGSLGAEMEGQFNFTTGTTLTLLVGGAGGGYWPANYTGGGGGGGGSFVINGGTPLVIAGGGGGAGGSGGSGFAGSVGTSGGDGGTTVGPLSPGGSGGSDGSGGQYPNPQNVGPYGGGGGGGYSGDGGSYSSGNSGSFVTGGSSFLDGGGGGLGGGRNWDPSPGLYAGIGGYGGGGGGGYSGGLGGSGGGGGGYSGGGGGGYNGTPGGGGGSIIDSSAIAILTEVSGVASPDDSPNGEIIITAVPEPTTLALAGLGGLSLLLFRRRRQAPLGATCL